MPLLYQKFITRNHLLANPSSFYVFGDNFAKKGMKGQAAHMRGAPNAIGIPTKHYPSMKREALFSDEDFDTITRMLRPYYNQIQDILNQDRTVIWPTGNIGTGLSKVSEVAPRIWEEMEQARRILEKIN